MLLGSNDDQSSQKQGQVSLTYMFFWWEARLLLSLEEMTTTKTKRRKSDQLSRPGPEELSVYSSTKNIWMAGKASSFPGAKTQANSRRSADAFF